MQEVLAATSNDHSARWLASTQLKQLCIRSWRARPGQGCVTACSSRMAYRTCRRRRRGVTQEERSHLRTRLFCLIPEPDNKIAVQVALVFAKVARSDFPHEWPNLFHDLLSNLDTSGGSGGVPFLEQNRL